MRYVQFSSASRAYHSYSYSSYVAKTRYRYPKISIFGLAGAGTGAGIWTWSSKSTTLKADAGPKAQRPFDNATITVTGSSQSTKTPSNSSTIYTTSKPDTSVPGEQPPPPQTTAQDQKDEKDQRQATTWSWFSDRINSVKWAQIPDNIRDLVVPDWLRLFPAFMTKLQDELSMAPGTVAEEIWREANDPEVNPEIIWDASVRVSESLCNEEKEFLQKRRPLVKAALAKYLDIPESEIHPDDVPVIAMCGSGGGLRALIAGTSSYLSAREAGLFDCLTYTAGVSGNCWLQALYFSTIGKQDHEHMIRHFKHRLSEHLAYPPAAFNLINSAPTNKFLLTGLVEKLKGTPDADFGIVDVYGMLLAGRLLVPKAELAVDLEDLKISNQKRYLLEGQHPLPIYTAVRHEIPISDSEKLTKKELKEKQKQQAWFQWFEFTPYETFCEEIGAGIPTWALGRNFDNGKTVWRENGLALPETRLPLLMGIMGSAFCATLSHYYKEIRPVMKGLAGFGGIDQLIAERDEDLIKLHPIDPAAIPNFAHGMKDSLPSSCPDSMFDAKYLQLMDAGMSNNLPVYPLLRPEREVDIVIAFDWSADTKTDNWLKVVDGYVKQRNIIGWPVGAGWPTPDESKEDTVKELEEAQAKTQKDAEQNLKQAQANDTKSNSSNDLSFCNVWVGTSTDYIASTSEPPSSSSSSSSSSSTSNSNNNNNCQPISPTSLPATIRAPTAGISVIYFPLLPNPHVPDVDPLRSDFMSTWNFVYSPAQIDSLGALARANFAEGRDQTRSTVRAVYERKRAARRERERRLERDRGAAAAAAVLGVGDFGDQFS